MVIENVCHTSQISLSSARSSRDSTSIDAGSFSECSNSTLSSIGFRDSVFPKSPCCVGPPVNLHSHPSLRRKNHSPNYQYRQDHCTRLETDDDPIEAEHGSSPHTLPSRQYSQHSIGMAATFNIDDDTDLRRKEIVKREEIGYVEMRTSLSPPKRDTYEDMSVVIIASRESDTNIPSSYATIKKL